ncbi:hypothetical protein DFR70_10716 [Nocardia tenerifensis]|uniref:Lipoprotein n=1 Tax=Nocardia tenerifensis TaxID=228006 RepID=A0A318KAT2_9NOCA|nr:hypothetical protein [Nocardia tenerifensis]PXX62149.1 hypothetical protein DFR70_10716 [Nocardia tenerifensis]
MLRRAGLVVSATALATVACAGAGGAEPTTTPPAAPTTKIDITAAELTGDGVTVSVTYVCEATDKPVTLQVFVRGLAEGAQQTIGATTKATCNAERQSVSVTAAKIPDAEPFTPAAGETVRIFGTLVSGDNQKSLDHGTAVRRMAVA